MKFNMLKVSLGVGLLAGCFLLGLSWAHSESLVRVVTGVTGVVLCSGVAYIKAYVDALREAENQILDMVTKLSRMAPVSEAPNTNYPSA
jgi:hypothetical protein